MSDREQPRDLSRRQFLRGSVCAAVGMTSLAATAFDLRRVAAAAPLDGDFKALVCVFLYGGNDSNNVLVPRGTEYGMPEPRRGWSSPRCAHTAGSGPSIWTIDSRRLTSMT